MLDWFDQHQTLLYWLSGASILLFLATLIVVPIMIVRIPPDYFADREQRPSPRKERRPVVRLALKVGKNLLGGLLILAGVVMLALPGQGVLAILAGVLVSDFPGKYRIARWIVSRKRVLSAINWLRKRAKRPPLRVTGAGGPPSKTKPATKSARRAA